MNRLFHIALLLSTFAAGRPDAAWAHPLIRSRPTRSAPRSRLHDPTRGWPRRPFRRSHSRNPRSPTSPRGHPVARCRDRLVWSRWLGATCSRPSSNLGAKRITSIVERRGVEPSVMLSEYKIGRVVLSHPAFRAGFRNEASRISTNFFARSSWRATTRFPNTKDAGPQRSGVSTHAGRQPTSGAGRSNGCTRSSISEHARS